MSTKRKLVTEIEGWSSSSSSSRNSHADDDDDDDRDKMLEPWVDWIKRATRVAEAQAELAGIPDWATEQMRRKYRLAGHVSRRDDGRWATKVLYWSPEGGTRGRGHPEQRWTDDFDKFFGRMLGAGMGEWREVAEDRDAWKLYEDDFVTFLER